MNKISEFIDVALGAVILLLVSTMTAVVALCAYRIYMGA